MRRFERQIHKVTQLLEERLLSSLVYLEVDVVEADAAFGLSFIHADQLGPPIV